MQQALGPETAAWKLHPVPVKDVLSVELSPLTGAFEKSVEVTPEISDPQFYEISLNQLFDGLYSVTIVSGREVLSRKFIKN